MHECCSTHTLVKRVYSAGIARASLRVVPRITMFCTQIVYFDVSFTKVFLMQNLAKLEIRNILIFVVVVYKVQNMLF